MLKNEGYCFCCDSSTIFESKNDWYRDFYLCRKCKSIPRERALLFCLEKFFPDWRSLTIHESSPALRRRASWKIKKECKNYIPSQYYPNKKRGSFHKRFRVENLENLTFEDESIDLHITQDVVEHLLNPEKAFAEIARTLKPGGAHIFSVPLVNKQNPSERWAGLDENGKIVYYHTPPEYHGNPINSSGSLVTMYWGYDITRHIFDASGLFTDIIYIDALEYGIRAEYIEILITRK